MIECRTNPYITKSLPGVLARSLAMLLEIGVQAVPKSITSGIFFSEDLVMKIFLWSFFLFCCFKKSSCQLMVKECMLSTGKLHVGGLPLV